MRDGKTIAPRPSLAESCETFAEEFAALPEGFKAIRNPQPYPVDFTTKLKTLREETTEYIRRN